MDSIDYPLWKEFGLPQYLVKTLRNIQACDWLDFLVQNKVYHNKLKSNFRYLCNNCGYTKNINRIYEDYAVCERCSSDKITSNPGWVFYRQDTQYSSTDGYILDIINKMQANYKLYFNSYAPDDFIDFKPKTRREDTCFYAKFICGEAVEASRPGLAICKAAILCPFIWDDAYDWKNNYKREFTSHITPIIYQMSNLGGDITQRRPKFTLPPANAQLQDFNWEAGEPEEGGN